MFVGNGDKILVPRDLDAKRIANCKSKKAKGVYEMMKVLSAANGQSHVNIY
jgi:hypothetical protein